MSTPITPTAKFRPWKVIIDGHEEYISVLSTGVPDSMGGWHFASPIYYNNLVSYSAQEVVYVSPYDALVTVGTKDPDSKKTVFASAGTWVAIRAVVPLVVDAEHPFNDLAVGTYYRIPQVPWPVPSDPDNDLNYWMLVTPDNSCVMGN